MSRSQSPFAWLTRLFTRWTQSLDQKYGWHTFPLPIGLVILIGLRTILRQKNLYDAYPDESTVLTPNPRVVSLELLTRDTFQPVTILNMLAAAWVQFMIHDWFSHC